MTLSDSHADDELLAQAAAGDQEAVTRLLGHYRTRLKRMVDSALALIEEEAACESTKDSGKIRGIFRRQLAALRVSYNRPASQ